MKIVILFLFAFFALSNSYYYGASKYKPVVIWHGMGDTCCNPFSMGKIMEIIKKELPGIYILSVKIGNSFEQDEMHGFFGNVNDQVRNVCSIIEQNPYLKDGYNAIGFSQGGQFLRAVAQRCPQGMNNLISIGGQHEGVYGLPKCPGSEALCNFIRKMLNKAAYSNIVQSYSVQGQYWHDPLNDEEYREKSRFIGEINCEDNINKTYKTNLVKLKNFVMVKFLKDSMVVPIDSEWFGFYAPNQSTKIINLQNSTIFKEDRIGLKELYDTKRLHFLSVDGDHLRFSEKWFISEIIEKFLS